jgi:rod shape-determining protein MreC
VATVERRADSGFARISCTPEALVEGARHVMVLLPISGHLPPRPAPEDAPAPVKKAGRK